ncbi:MAG: hypothetical protein Kow0010_26240 [Dehalococcoidia bacterium]
MGRHEHTSHHAGLIQAGRRALARGEWDAARHFFTEACADGDSPEALEGLASCARWSPDEQSAFACAERAYALYRARDDRRGAARVAFMLADDCLEWRGEYAVARGWLHRARRMLQGFEHTAEYARLRFYEGYLPLMERNDTVTAVACARETISLATDLANSDLEALGLALEGLAMVSMGEVEPGMARLDEAAAAVIGGDVDDPEIRGTAFCFLIDACGRARDFPRVAQWLPRIQQLCQRVHMEAAFSICRPNYAQALVWRGLWPEAESELQTAASDLGEFRPPMAAEAVIRLAELRCRQGRFEESAALFAAVEPDPLAHLGLGQLALARGDPATALDYYERYLRRLPPRACAERASGLELLVPALLAAGDIDRAKAAAAELDTLADRIGTAPFRAAARFSQGVVMAASGDMQAARQCLEDAIDLSSTAGGLFEAARARLELAAVLAVEESPAAAAREAREALAAFQRVGADHLRARAEDLLASFGQDASARDPGPRYALGLTPREEDVLALIAEGMSNAEIAAALVLSVRTVERHISNIYTKLGLDGPSARARAAALAVERGIVRTRT